ncbi:RlpA-like double-psi beta-barrel domain-containing protein [Acidisoma sp. C75]
MMRPLPPRRAPAKPNAAGPASARPRAAAAGLAALSLALLPLAGCMGPPPITPHPRYTIGQGYEADGVWHYPREDFGYDRTGLASIYGADAPRETADGEAYSPRAMAAASPVLQLPCIVRVTDLETGRQLILRVNDRGPADPGRILAVTPRAAALLGMAEGGVAEVRVTVLKGPSEALADQLGGGIKIAAAPVGGFQAASLAPPPGVAAAGGPAIGQADRANQPAAPEVVPPLRLPEQLSQVPPSPGALFIQSGSFGNTSDAFRAAARLAGLPDPRILPIAGEGRTLYGVRTGPYPSVASADAALRASLAAGAVDASIIVQ